MADSARRVNPTGADAQAACRELAAAVAAPRFRLEVRRWREEEAAEIAASLKARNNQVYHFENGGSANGAPEGGASSLDHLGISDRSRENPTLHETESDQTPPDPPRATFLPPDAELAAVERLTEGHRRAKAARHRSRAAAAARGVRELGQPFEPLEVDAVAPARTPEERAAWPAARRASVILPRRTGAVGRTLDERQDLRDAADRTIRWHNGRARGALERFDRVENCGKRKVRAKCNACGIVHEVPDRCGCDRLCHACRASSRKHRVRRMADAQIRALTNAQRQGLLNRFRNGGRWSERLITLTVPHFEREFEAAPDLERTDRTVEARIAALFGAWRRFALKLNAWSRAQAKRHAGRRPAFYRGFEWTPGNDGRGHPHFHLWVFSPFVPYGGRFEPCRTRGHRRVMRAAPCAAGSSSRPRAVAPIVRRAHVPADAPIWIEACAPQRMERGLRDWWRESLAAEGIEGAERAICDVRAAHARDPRDSGIRAEVLKGAIRVTNDAGQRVQRYVEGWSLADLRDASGALRVTDEVLAALYEALDGRRLVATSPHLLAARHVGCQECGAVGWTRTELLEAPPGAGAPRPRESRAPPD